MAGNMNNLMAIEVDVPAAAGNYDYVTTRAFEVIDMNASTDATVGAVTATPQRGVGGSFNALGAALATDTVDDIEYATTIIAAQATVDAGDTLRVVVANAGDFQFYFYVIPTTWIAG